MRPEMVVCNKCQYNDRPFVPREGPINAKILIIGEAPGKAEVIARRPFVGRSGSLLRNVIKDLKINDYCIDNACPCGVTKDFDYDQMKRCVWERYQGKRFDLVIALGKVAQTVMKDVHIYDRIVHMYHPAYVLRGGTSVTLWLWPLKEVLYGPDERLHTT